MKSFNANNKRSLSSLSKREEPKTEGWASIQQPPSMTVVPPRSSQTTTNVQENTSNVPLPASPVRAPTRVLPRSLPPNPGIAQSAKTLSPPRANGIPPSRNPVSFPDRPPAGAGLVQQRLNMPPPSRTLPQRVAGQPPLHSPAPSTQNGSPFPPPPVPQYHPPSPAPFRSTHPTPERHSVLTPEAFTPENLARAFPPAPHHAQHNTAPPRPTVALPTTPPAPVTPPRMAPSVSAFSPKQEVTPTQNPAAATMMEVAVPKQQPIRSPHPASPASISSSPLIVPMETDLQSTTNPTCLTPSETSAPTTPNAASPSPSSSFLGSDAISCAASPTAAATSPSGETKNGFDGGAPSPHYQPSPQNTECLILATAMDAVNSNPPEETVTAIIASDSDLPDAKPLIQEEDQQQQQQQPEVWTVSEEALAAMAQAETEALESVRSVAEGSESNVLPVAQPDAPSSPSTTPDVARSTNTPPPLPLSGKLTISGGTPLPPPPFKGVIKVPVNSPLKGTTPPSAPKKKPEEVVPTKQIDKKEREIESLKDLLQNERHQSENLKKKCFDADKTMKEMKAQLERLSTQIKFKDNEMQELMHQQRQQPIIEPVSKWEKEGELCSVDSPHSEEVDAMNTANASGAATFRSLQSAPKLKVSFSASTKGGAGGPGKKRMRNTKHPEADSPPKKKKRESIKAPEPERGRNKELDPSDENQKLKMEVAQLKSRLRGIKRAANGEVEKEDGSLKATFGRETKKLKLDLTEVIHSQLETFGAQLLEQQRNTLEGQLGKLAAETVRSIKEIAPSLLEESMENNRTNKKKTLQSTPSEDNSNRSSQQEVSSAKRKLKLVYNKCLNYKSQLTDLRARDEEKTKQIGELQGLLNKAEEENASLRRANESFTNTNQRVAELEGKMKEAEALQLRVQELEKEKKALLLMRDKAREKRKKQKEECHRQEKRLRELEEKANGAIKDRDLLAEWARGKERENEDFKRERTALESKLQAQEEELKKLGQTAAEQNSRLNEKDEALGRYQKEHEELQLKLKALEQAKSIKSLNDVGEEEEDFTFTGLTMPTAEGTIAAANLLTPSTGILKMDLDLSQMDELSQDLLADEKGKEEAVEDIDASQSISQILSTASTQQVVAPKSNPDGIEESSESQENM